MATILFWAPCVKVNTMGADELSMPGATASAATVLTHWPASIKLNSSVPGKFGCDFKDAIVKLVSLIGFLFYFYSALVLFWSNYDP